jgi:hypothetical protein
LKGEREMKMKKILSMGALGLVVACSTSVGALGAERPSNDKIKTDMANLFLSNRNPLNYSLNANTIASGVVNTGTIKTDAINYGYYDSTKFPNVKKAIDLMNPNATMRTNAINIFTNVDSDGLLNEVREITKELRDMENASDSTDKIALEKDITSLIKEKNTGVTVNFGKNIDGRITMSIFKENQIILQLNSGNAYTISKTLDSGSNLDKYAELLKIVALS